jgi:imidazole glycerol phosphate synthase subunit HisF
MTQALEVVQGCAGEVLTTSIDCDDTGKSFELPMIQALACSSSMSLTATGGFYLI